MTVRRFAVAGLAALAIAAVAAPVAQAREFEGVIVAKNASAKTFTIREDDIEATARRAKGRWIATSVERRR